MNVNDRWDLTNVYPSLESPELEAAIAETQSQIQQLEHFTAERLQSANIDIPTDELAALLGEALERLNALLELSGTIRAYIYSFVTTDSHNQVARKKFSEYEQISLPFENCQKVFESWVGKISPKLEQALPRNETTQAHAFFLREQATQARYLMSDVEEKLAAELSLSGARAWSNLQGVITSQLHVEFELNGEVQKLSMPSLINLHTHPDETVDYYATAQGPELEEFLKPYVEP